jgi:hypothetical protein
MKEFATVLECMDGLLQHKGAAGMRLRQHDLDLGLTVGDEGDPTEAVVGDLVLHRQAEGIAVEAEGDIGIVDIDVHCAE